nr:MAG TPA: hypothetical protein [Bacteriophage sp.]
MNRYTRRWDIPPSFFMPLCKCAYNRMQNRRIS